MFVLPTHLEASTFATRSEIEMWNDESLNVAAETPPFSHGVWRPGGGPTTPPEAFLPGTPPGPPPPDTVAPFTPPYPPPRTPPRWWLGGA